MPIYRRKISAVYGNFIIELQRLERLDGQNQRNFSTPVGGKAAQISLRQMHFLTESIFFAAYRAYESFVRDCFLLYCLGATTRAGASITSYLNPKDFPHAEKLIQSSMPHLDWTNPETMITRSELYLKDGFPFKLPYSTNISTLHDFRRIRNHIAHNSKESLDHYKITLRSHYSTIPLIIPSPGEFLLFPDNVNPTKYKLLTFFELLEKLSNDLT